MWWEILKLIIWSAWKIKPQSYKQMIWDSRILLPFNNAIDNTKNNKWQKGINKWRQLYTVLPFIHLSVCAHASLIPSTDL